MHRIIIACDSCGSKFYVPSSDIYDSGRFVRCTICDHEWLVKKHETSPVAENIESKIDQNIVLVKSNKNYIYAASLLLFSVVLLFFAYFTDQISWQNLFEGDNIVQNFSEDLSIQNVNFSNDNLYDKRYREKNVQALSAHIVIENSSNKRKSLKQIDVIGMDYAKRPVTKITASPYEFIDANKIFSITIKLPVSNEKIEYVRIILNNKVQQRRDIFNQSDRLIKIQNISR